MNTVNCTLDRNADHSVQEIGIPPCPAILTKLLRETRADDPDFRRVSRLIGGDVALAAAVLQVANSSFFGLRTKASSVQQALALLGLITVTQLVTGLLLRQAFPRSAGPAMERYWKASMATSLISALLCRETTRGDSGVARTYGLFRDCGMPVMLRGSSCMAGRINWLQGETPRSRAAFSLGAAARAAGAAHGAVRPFAPRVYCWRPKPVHNAEQRAFYPPFPRSFSIRLARRRRAVKSPRVRQARYPERPEIIVDGHRAGEAETLDKSKTRAVGETEGLVPVAREDLPSRRFVRRPQPDQLRDTAGEECVAEGAGLPPP